MIRLSFIVPFYGVEKYIEECIRSLYDQDIPQEEYEVICVDDCSPDGSRAIVERLQNEYHTLRLLIHTENKRQGGARNTGLREAKGKYIWFVDSDDCIVPNVLNKLLRIAEENRLEVLNFDYKGVGEQKSTLLKYETGVISGEQYVFCQKGRNWSDQCSVVWNCIIERAFLQREKLLFREHVFYEDSDYAFEMYSRAKRVMHIPQDIYESRLREESTNNQVKDVSHIMNYVELLKSCIDIEKRMTGIWQSAEQDFIRNLSLYIIKELKKRPEEERNYYFGSRNRIIGIKPSYLQWYLYLGLSCKWYFNKLKV